MNNFQIVMSAAWNLMCTEFTLYGFTLSYGKIYLFSLLIGIVTLALFKMLWG